MDNKATIFGGAMAVAALASGLAISLLSQDPLAEPGLRPIANGARVLQKDEATANYFLRCGIAFERLAALTPESGLRVQLGPAILNTSDFRRASPTLLELGTDLSPVGQDHNFIKRVERQRFKERFSVRSTRLIAFADRCLASSYEYAPAFISAKARSAASKSSSAKE